MVQGSSGRRKPNNKKGECNLIYKFAEGSIHSVSAQIVGPILNKMGEEGRLTPKNVVDEARPQESPLHPEFEWNDAVAAEKWREKQAQLLIAHTICIQDDNPSVPPTRAFYVTVEKSHYEPISVILKDESKREVLLENAKRELISLKKKYSTLQELSNVFIAIDQLTIDDINQ